MQPGNSYPWRLLRWTTPDRYCHYQRFGASDVAFVSPFAITNNGLNDFQVRYFVRYIDRIMVLAVMLSLPLLMLCLALLSFVVSIMAWTASLHVTASTAVAVTTFLILLCATVAGFVFFRNLWERL